MRPLQIENDTLVLQFEKLDNRVDAVRSLMERLPENGLRELWNNLDVSAIYHDCALEGEVLSPDELRMALDPSVITDATNQSLFRMIQNHKQAFELARKKTQDPHLVFDLELFRMFHLIFAPTEVEPGTAGYRRDIPLHRAYYHEIDAAETIGDNLNELIFWFNGMLTHKSIHPISLAARFHHRFMHIFPYPHTSGKVGRIVMNIYLMRNGFLPAVVHATERQRYYESIRTSYQTIATLLVDSERASLDSAIRFLKRALLSTSS